MWLSCVGVDFRDRKHSQVRFESNSLTVKTRNTTLIGDKRGEGESKTDQQVGESEFNPQRVREECGFQCGVTQATSTLCTSPVIAAKPGHSGEKQGQGRDREKHEQQGSGKGSQLEAESEVMVPAAILCGAKLQKPSPTKKA